MKLFLVALGIALAASGCAKEKPALIETDDQTASGARWASFPVPIQADEIFLAQEGADEDFQAALKFWEKHAGKKLFTYSAANPWRQGRPFLRARSQAPRVLGNVVFLETHEWAFRNRGANAGKTLIEASDGLLRRAAIVIQPPSADSCPKDCGLRQPNANRRALLAHELGHFLGLGHSSDTDNIMTPTLMEIRKMDDYVVDQTELEKLTR